MWRIFGFELQHRTPNVTLLIVHLEGEHVVVHGEADNLEQSAKANESVSDLMKYFGRPPGPGFDNLTFLYYFENHTVQPKK